MTRKRPGSVSQRLSRLTKATWCGRVVFETEVVVHTDAALPPVTKRVSYDTAAGGQVAGLASKYIQ